MDRSPPSPVVTPRHSRREAAAGSSPSVSASPTRPSPTDKRKSRITSKIKLAASEAFFKLDSLLSARKIGQETRSRIHSILNDFKRSTMRALRDHVSDSMPVTRCSTVAEAETQTDLPPADVSESLLDRAPPSRECPATRKDLEETAARIIRSIRKHTKRQLVKSAPSAVGVADVRMTSRPPTYADKVRRQENTESIPTPVLITRPPDAGNSDHDIRQDMEKVVGTDEWQEVRVRGVRRVKQGILVKVADRQSAAAITNSAQLKTVGLVATEARQRNPRIAIYGMEREITKEQFMEDFYSQNFRSAFSKEDYLRDFRLLYQIGNKDHPRTTWVAEVSPQVRKRLLEQARIYRGWTSYRLEDYCGVTRCYRCHRYGHLARNCRSAEACGHCGAEGHNIRTCPHTSDAPKCANCMRLGKQHDHSVVDRSCTVYQAQQDYEIERTRYGA